MLAMQIRPTATPSCAFERDTRQCGGLHVILGLHYSPPIPPPRGVVISGPATSHHSVHTSRVAPLRSGTAPPKSEAMQHTQGEGRANLLTTQQLAVSSHSSASIYVDPTPLLARRPGRGRGKAVQVAPIPLVAWTPARNGAK